MIERRFGSFSERTEMLGPLQSFDPSALCANDEYPKELCDFIIALAVAHNDFTDILYAVSLVNSPDGKTPGQRNRAWALRCGISIHLTKARAALFYEIAQLIRENKNVLDNVALAKIIQRMPKKHRQSWESIVEGALSARARNTPLTRLLGSVRDKTAAHFDAQQLGIEYRRRFAGEANDNRPPLISRGNEALASRFYFADAILETMLDRLDPESSESFARGTHPVINQTDAAIFFLVTGFISARSAWRSIVEEV